jgi:hypothetical protein
VSFFEPLPPEKPQRIRQWGPPAWDRPSEGTLPATFAVDGLLHRNDAVAVCVDCLKVYPNGFTINIVILTNPHTAHERVGVMGEAGRRRMLRVGVRFADGRSAGRSATWPGGGSMSKDDQGIPTEPVLRMTGGGGGTGRWRFGAWVFQLPPEGPLEIFVGLPVAGLEEASVTVDGGSVREAASRATVLWQ